MEGNMDLEVKEGVIIDTKEEQKKLVVDLARRLAAQKVSENLDGLTDKIDAKFAKITIKKENAESDAAEFEIACEWANGVVRETLQAACETAYLEVAKAEELLENSRGDVLVAYTDRIAKAYLDAMAKVINAARRELRDGLQTSAGEIAKSIRSTEKIDEDVSATIKYLD